MCEAAMTAARCPTQQLGAAPGSTAVLPGNEGNEFDDDGGVEFASSGEAERVPREHANLDAELPEELLEQVRIADHTAREAANLGNGTIGPVGENFVMNAAERLNEGAGLGEAIFAQAA